ncbi:MAG TPA: alpha-hydroxy acid oxidase [Kribbella sp.]|jgi:4-hydroxymandelate oxidase
MSDGLNRSAAERSVDNRTLDTSFLADLDELEHWASASWDTPVRAMVQGGAGSRATLSANISAWSQWALRSRVLVDVSQVDTSTTVLGVEHRTPILIAPTGLHTLVHPDGEVATAIGARDFDTTMILSSGTGRTCRDVRSVGGRTWFQFYWGRDRSRVRDNLQMAVAAGCSAICLTADLPVPPLLDAEMRYAVANLPGGPPLYVLPRKAHVAGGEWDHDSRLTWSDLAWLRETVDVPVVVKGITTAEDAVAAAHHGVDAIVVSNHGGRSLDHGRPTAACLVEVADALGALGSAPEILVDGGIRRGRDIAVALALGATAVLVGRPVLWGLAANGASGVHDVLAFFHRELVATMGMIGAAALSDLDRSRVERTIYH